MPAGSASLAARIPLLHRNKGAPVPRRFVGKLPDQLAPADSANGVRQRRMRRGTENLPHSCGGVSTLLQAADVLLVGGGESLYLCYWIRQTGLADSLPSLLHDMVYVGASAGSILVTPTFGEAYNGIEPPTSSDKALGLVDFTLRPHLDADYAPTATVAHIAPWATTLEVPVYAIDDQTARKVIDGVAEVVSEGHWVRCT